MGLFNKVQVVTKLWYDDYLIIDNGVVKVVQSKDTMKCSYKLYRDYNSALASLLGMHPDAIEPVINPIYSVIYNALSNTTPVYINDFCNFLKEKVEYINHKREVTSPYYYIRFMLPNGSYVPHNDQVYSNKFVRELIKAIRYREIKLEFNYSDFVNITMMFADKITLIYFNTDRNWGELSVKGVFLDSDLETGAILGFINLLNKSIRPLNPKYKIVSLPNQFYVKWGTCSVVCDSDNRFGFDTMRLLDIKSSDIMTYTLSTKDDIYWSLSAYGGSNASGAYEDYSIHIRDYKKNEYHFYSLDDNMNVLCELPVKEFNNI